MGQPQSITNGRFHTHFACALLPLAFGKTSVNHFQNFSDQSPINRCHTKTFQRGLKIFTELFLASIPFVDAFHECVHAGS